MQPPKNAAHMNYNLNSLKVGYMGDYVGDYYRAYNGDTWSLDYGSYELGRRPPCNSGIIGR